MERFSAGEIAGIRLACALFGETFVAGIAYGIVALVSCPFFEASALPLLRLQLLFSGQYLLPFDFRLQQLQQLYPFPTESDSLFKE